MNEVDLEKARAERQKQKELNKVGARYTCRGCGLVMKIGVDETPHKCGDCGKEDWEFLGKEYYTKTQYNQALAKFKKNGLLNLVWDELSKTHIEDNKLKLTNFLIALSSLLKNPKNRMSMAITGNSAEGKDNLIKTCLNCIPKDLFVFLTSGTQATIEDDIKDKRIIAFSEVNANRDNGANKFLTEVIKQVTEGGTSAMKKDIRSGMKSARHEKGVQMSVLFGTTEEGMDTEMQTRFIKGTITTDPVRIKKVNDNTLDTFSDLDKLLKDSKESDNWVRIGLSYFFYHKEPLEVFIPYAKFLKDKVSGKHVFDDNNPRSQRDIKRVLSITSAMTYLFQEQRRIIEHEGVKVLISEPQDLINTLNISEQFFNQSYSGLDKRLSKVIEIMKEIPTEWVARDDLESMIGVTRNTIKQYCHTLAEEGLIEGVKGSELNCQNGLKIYNGNKIYYKRCQKGVKRPLIRCEINELKAYLEQKTKKQIDTFSFTHNSDDKKNEKGIKKKVSKKASILKTQENLTISSEIDTFKLTPFTPEEIEKAGYTQQEIDDLTNLGEKSP